MKVIKFLDEHLEEYLLATFLLGIVLSMSTHVFFRYVLHNPLSWTEELTRYLFICFVFMGISYGIKKDIHLRVNILETVLPKLKPYLKVIQLFLFTVFVVYLLPVALDVTNSLLVTGQTSPSLKVKMAYIYGSFLLGLILSLVRLVQRWIIDIKGWRREGFQKYYLDQVEEVSYD